MAKEKDPFQVLQDAAITTLQLALYFLRTILEDRKKGLYLVFLEEEMWKIAEKSPMAAFLKKYQGGASAPCPPPGRDTWSDLVVKRLGDEFILLWRTKKPVEESYEAVDRAILVVRELLKILRSPDAIDAETRAIVTKLADRGSARAALREIVMQW